MVTSNTKSYFQSVEKSHRKYSSTIKRAKSRKNIMTIYWRHKRDHEAILRKHLREEMAEVNRLKKKIK